MGKIALTTLLLLIPATAIASNTAKPPKWALRNYLEMAWSPALALGNTHDEAGVPCFAGGMAGYRMRLNPGYSVGVRLSGHLLEDRHPDLSPAGTPGIRNVDLRLLNLGATAHRYFPHHKTRLPYLGLAAGALREAYRSHLETEVRHTRWHPALGAEVGMIILLGQVPLLLNAKITFGTPTHGVDSLASLELGMGVGIPN